MILAIDTSSAACSAALIGADGALVAAADERIGRGHAERLAPMIAEMLAGRMPHLDPGRGRTGQLHRHPRRDRRGARAGDRLGRAAGGNRFARADRRHRARRDRRAPAEIGVAQGGGHGELFVRAFRAAPLVAIGDPANLTPAAAAAAMAAPLVVGSGAAALVEARGAGSALDILPSARFALALPEALRTLDPRPSYGRAPDARPLVAA